MLRDAPDIRAAERTGYPNGQELSNPICPVCGDECDSVYLDHTGQVVGCTSCLKLEDAWEVKACFPEKED